MTNLSVSPALVGNRGEQFGQQQEELADQGGGREDLQQRCNKCGQSHGFLSF